MRLFFALAASEGMTVLLGDTTNAYQQSPPPTEQCYLEIDDAYISWYKKRFNEDVNPKTHVIPVHRALQGHPEAGALWEKMITGILKKHGFTTTTHERNLYRGKIDGQTVLICRQVDDYAVACRDTKPAEKLIKLIDKEATTSSEGICK